MGRNRNPRQAGTHSDAAPRADEALTAPSLDPAFDGAGGSPTDWDELGPEFLAWSAARNSPKYVLEQGKSLDRWRDFLDGRGVFYLADVRPADVEAYAPWRRQQLYRGKPVGIVACNRDLAVIKSLFSWALRTEHLQRDPTKAARQAREFEGTRPIVIVDIADFERVLENLARQEWADASVGLLGTGMRWGSLANLARGDIDPRTRRVRQLRPKGKRAVEFIVSERTFAAIDRVVGRLSPDVSAYDKALAKVCERLNVPRFTAHHLRHTFACSVLAAGADPRHVQEWLGHASITTTERYLHFIKSAPPPAPI